MDTKLEHSLVKGCLRIRLTGTWTAERADQIITDIFSIWEKYQKPLLIDVRDLEDTPSIFRDYQEVGKFVSAGFRRVGRIAVLDYPQRREANDFLETAAQNQGMRFVFFYSSEEDAIAWLLPEEDK
jgi:hypothetical protein